jgi:probable HAF family extracellular repeat protein
MKRLGALACVAVTLFTVLSLTGPLAAQGQPQKADKTHYTIQDLGTLGGTFSWAYAINNRGTVAGYAFLAGDTARHAFLWRKGVMTDLGTLGGPNSSEIYVINEKDEVPGAAETSTPDPFGDDFCAWGTYLTCAPFLWAGGVMTQFPTLGGNNGEASSVNNRGQVVGLVENTTPDNCGFKKFQMRPVIWRHGQIKELPLLSGDTIGTAWGINDPGQVVGTSESCAIPRAVLWEKGNVRDLGGLGGTYSFANGINNQGQVFGGSYLTNNTTNHAFLWEKHRGMKDLGTVPGDFSSIAWGMDNKGRVVGNSCDESGNCRAFLWQDGVMTDLNTLISPDSPWFLVEADWINSRGEIVGAAFNATTGELHAFLATPKGCGKGAESDSLAAQSDNRARPTVVLPENVRKLLQQRKGNRFGVGLTRPQ